MRSLFLVADMPLQISCPQCHSKLAVSSSSLGSKIRCSKCQTVISVARNPQPQPERDFSSLPTAPLPSTTVSPFHYTHRKRSGNNKAIIVTAIVGACVLIFLAGFAVLYHVATGGDRTADSSGSDATLDDLLTPKIHTGVSSDDVSSGPTGVQPTNERTLVDPSDTPPSSGLDPLASLPAASEPTATRVSKPAPPKRLSPPDESDLHRVHVPNGYSIAVPAGFSAVNRAVNKTSAIYNLVWQDGVRISFIVTDDKSLSADSPIPPVRASTSPDGKRTIKPIATTAGTDRNETYKLDGMNVSFAEISQDVSHEDMTEQLQVMFSGAMTPEMKRQYAHLMEKKVGFQTTLVMKGMDDGFGIEIMISAERPTEFSAPDLWLRILRTLRHESEPQKSRIPLPFLYGYKNG